MEEIRNENVNDVEEEIEEVNAETEESGTAGLAIVITAGFALVSGIAALIYKNRDKFEEKRIERLRKKGYVIYKESENNDNIVDVDFDDYTEE